MTLAAAEDAPIKPAAAPLSRTVAAGKRLDALTGLRFFAAFFILFSHASEWVAPFRNSDAIAHYGGAPSIYGMPLFFVLSGFVIQYNYGSLFESMRFRWAAVEFIGARFARLYPLFICFFAVGLIVDFTITWLGHHPGWWIRMFLHYVTMTQSWFYMIIFEDRMIMNNAFGLAWSISTEFFFYICFLSLVFFTLRIKNWGSCLAIMIIFSATILYMLIKANAHLPIIENIGRDHIENFVTASEKWSDSFLRWLFYYSPYARVFEFILGCLTARLYFLLADTPVCAQEAFAGKVAQVVAFLWLLFFGFATTFNGPTSVIASYANFLALNFGCAVPIAVTIFCVSRYQNWLSTFLGSASLVALGEISYSIYVVHTWTLRIFIRDPVDFSKANALDAVIRIGLGIALTLILATATYRLIEMPGRRWLRSLSGRALIQVFGAREANVAGIDSRSAVLRAFAAVSGIVLLLAACVAYQLSYSK
jgi:peptidoglycan/LPS O-acetylase OafA/YrhL